MRKQLLILPSIFFLLILLIFFYLLIIDRNPSELPSTLLNKNVPKFETEYLLNDKKFIIHRVRGSISFINDFDNCIKTRGEIVEELEDLFKEAKIIKEIIKHPLDKTGKSIGDFVTFEFDSGNTIEVYCNDYEETLRKKNNWSEGLNVVIASEETNKWLGNY